MARERAELLLEAGRMPRLEVDQTRQDELRAENRLENAEQSYRASLDQFKVTLGLTPTIDLELDPEERNRLLDIIEQIAVEITPERASEIAVGHRLDLMNSLEAVEDAERNVKLARLNLRASADLVVGADMGTNGNSPTNFDEDGTDLNVGLDVDLPLDKLDERNAYRRALVRLDRTQRDYQESFDGVVLDVRDALRQYYRSRRSYDILRESLRLAQERVRSTSLLLEAGRASTRDMLEARESLLSAQNSLVAALVDYKLAGLTLARDMGILEVGPMGELEESFDDYK
jgi:outer membrane protein TolC